MRRRTRSHGTPAQDELTTGALRYNGIDKKEDIMNAKKLLIPMFALVLGTAVAAPAHATDLRAAAKDSVLQGVTIHVVNNNWLDMRVYAIVGSVRYRLGTVNGLGRETLKVPTSVVSIGNDLRLVAVPIGQRSANFAPVMFVSPGDDLEYRIESRLALSNLFKLF